MGCFTYSNRSHDQINRVDEIKVLPSNFISANDHSFQEVYQLRRCLGSGGFSEVHLVVHKTTQTFRAVKIFRRDKISVSDSRGKMQNEIEFLKSLDHPNIVRIYEFFEDSKRFYLVMEYCQGGELFEELIKRKSFSEQTAARIIQQLLSAVMYMHERSIIHRDLKPESILLENKGDDMSIKIIDFDNATCYQKNQIVKETQGTCYYIAPEVICRSYNEKCDLWSCGVILYVLLSGYPPFDGQCHEEILEKIKRGTFSYEGSVWETVSNEAKDLINSLICPSDRRLSAAEALRHPWITSNSVKTAQISGVSTALNNLRSFQKAGKLREAVDTIITTQLVSSESIKELREIFKAIDTDKDGRLSREELLTEYLKHFDAASAEEEVGRIMKAVDSDNSGFIDYSEFIKAAIDSKMLMSAENLKSAFGLFDKDDSGSISADEIRMVLEGGLRSNARVWTDIVKEVDLNGDGEIDLAEFENIILKNL